MPARFAVVCEAEADFRTATRLAERVLVDAIDWLEDEHLTNCPLWHGLTEGRMFLLWREVKDIADREGIKVHGHFDDRPAEPDARAARRALLLLKKYHQDTPLQSVLLIRDDDRDLRRREGLEQAREADKSGLRDRIVIGLAHCKRESWVLAGFDPGNDSEEARLAALRTELGFDPRTSSHDLTAGGKDDKRSAKRVLGELTEGDVKREACCWEETDLATLRSRGGDNGLTDYLDQVRERLVPAILHPPTEWSATDRA